MINSELMRLIAAVQPEVVIVSGDLAHRGRRDQIERATGLLRALGPPVIAVPGNHDIPYSVPARFSHPWREFERQWETTEPVYRSDHLLVCGLNSVQPWRQQSGRLRRSSIERAAGLLASAPPGVFRLVFCHHHLICAPWRARKRPLSNRGFALRSLAEAGVDLIASGHIHQASACEWSEFDTSAGRSLVLTSAPGLGEPRPRRRGEVRGLQLYSFESEEIAVETHIWQERSLVQIATRHFPRLELISK